MGKKKKVKEERERGVDYIIHEETDVREREKTIGNRDLSLDECLKGGRGQLNWTFKPQNRYKNLNTRCIPFRIDRILTGRYFL